MYWHLVGCAHISELSAADGADCLFFGRGAVGFGEFRECLFKLAVPLVIGVCVVTFLLFDVAFSPRMRAIQELGKHASEGQIAEMLHARGWDRGLFYNPPKPAPPLGEPVDPEAEPRFMDRFTNTRFFDHMRRLLLFDFGRSYKTHEEIGQKILSGAVPSLTLTVPIFVLGVTLGLCLSLGVAYFRATYLDLGAVVVCVAFMSSAMSFFGHSARRQRTLSPPLVTERMTS